MSRSCLPAEAVPMVEAGYRALKLRDRPVRARVRLVIENVHRAVADLQEIDVAGLEEGGVEDGFPGLAAVLGFVNRLGAGDVANFAAMNKVYHEFFPTDPPARSTVAVAALVVPNALIEIECAAAAPRTSFANATRSR